MGQALGEVLPYAVGAAIAPLPIIAIIVMLLTPKARVNGAAFVLGWMAGLAIVAGITILVSQGAQSGSGTSSGDNAARVQLLLGIVLLLAGARRWRNRPKIGDPTPMPKWLAAIDTFTAPKAAGTGLVLAGPNPKNLMMSIAAGLAIAGAGGSTGTQVGTLVVYVLLASVTVIAPYAVYLFRRSEADAILGGWRTWLSDHNAVVMAVLVLVIGAVLLGKGITGLST